MSRNFFSLAEPDLLDEALKVALEAPSLSADFDARLSGAISRSGGHSRAATERETAKPIRISTLGRFEIALDGAPLRFVFRVPRKLLALLMALLAAGSGGVALTLLCSTMWPNLDPKAATRALRITILRLRGLLGRKSALIVQEEKVALAAEQCWVDAWEFEGTLASARDSSETLWALRHYRGAFLSQSDHPLVIETRDRLNCKFIRSVSQLGASYERIGDAQSAIDLYLMALDADSGCEDLHQSLMRCLAKEGQVSAVAAAYHRCRAALQRRYGTEPSALTEKIFRESCQGHQAFEGSIVVENPYALSRRSN